MLSNYETIIIVFPEALRLLATVPGNVYSDLLRNNVLKGDPLFGDNHLNYRWVAYDNWTFHKSFNGLSVHQIFSQILDFKMNIGIYHDDNDDLCKYESWMF